MIEQIRPDVPKGEKLGKISFEIGSWNLPSIKHLKSEDSAFINGRYFGVFDGVGGSENGAEASTLAAEIISQSLKTNSPPTSIESAKNRLLTAFSQANRVILQRQRATSTHMDTTGVFGTLISTNSSDNYVVVANSGDSRLYLYSHGSLFRETNDHNHLYDKYGNSSKYDQIQRKLDNYDGSQPLTPEEKIFFSARNDIFQTIGSDLLPDIYFAQIKPGDIILLTTDGVSDNFTHDQLRSSIEKYQELPAQSISRLIATEAQHISKGKTIRSKPDDMTALAIKISR